MKNLEKLWNFKTAISRPGKVFVIEFNFTNLCIIELYLIRSEFVCIGYRVARYTGTKIVSRY